MRNESEVKMPHNWGKKELVMQSQTVNSYGRAAFSK